MTDEDEYFAQIDAHAPGENAMLVFADKATAMRYAMHRHNYPACGVLVAVEDRRTGSGLFVMWRDPVPPADIIRRQAQCLWMLEETLAGHYTMPAPGTIIPSVRPETWADIILRTASCQSKI